MYAEGAGDCREYELAMAVDRYGAAAIIGSRPMTANEVIGMNWARSVVTAYQSRKAAKSATEWVKRNPELSKLLDWAAGLAREQDGG